MQEEEEDKGSDSGETIWGPDRPRSPVAGNSWDRGAREGHWFPSVNSLPELEIPFSWQL